MEKGEEGEAGCMLICKKKHQRNGGDAHADGARGQLSSSPFKTGLEGDYRGPRGRCMRIVEDLKKGGGIYHEASDRDPQAFLLGFPREKSLFITSRTKVGYFLPRFFMTGRAPQVSNY